MEFIFQNFPRFFFPVGLHYQASLVIGNPEVVIPAHGGPLVGYQGSLIRSMGVHFRSQSRLWVLADCIEFSLRIAI
jgi:hypothetical protein